MNINKVQYKVFYSIGEKFYFGGKIFLLVEIIVLKIILIKKFVDAFCRLAGF